MIHVTYIVAEGKIRQDFFPCCPHAQGTSRRHTHTHPEQYIDSTSVFWNIIEAKTYMIRMVSIQAYPFKELCFNIYLPDTE